MSFYHINILMLYAKIFYIVCHFTLYVIIYCMSFYIVCHFDHNILFLTFLNHTRFPQNISGCSIVDLLLTLLIHNILKFLNYDLYLT